ncbi:hypothetical protein Pst134EA_000242 [Puccinia striiformis f. sp. tritici]|uniref:hypothetical protein n=1 Tax=Puccinia striiformis f. sp. tritici TaxID=168172 RepID=UPI0020079A7F|nr:hypothetical protein Pst134EA_000242 [Puccinia striiformis f. sp. tritici]KAH9473164.1 hypothetical protein Pst134EA_000242 [Puccinia striiformis f. sp. tritici]
MGCPGPSSTLFIGCQAIHFALANFLIHAPILSTSLLNSEDPHQRTGKSTSNVLEDTLLTKFVLGQYVGHQWELEKIMRWRELAPPSSSPCTSKIDASQPQSFHGTGLWTARGHVVEAIVGAVMAEHVSFFYLSLSYLLLKQYRNMIMNSRILNLVSSCHTTDSNHFEDTHQTFELSISIMLSSASSCIRTKALHSSLILLSYSQKLKL